MLEVVFLLVLGILWILGATIQDVRKREVANWLNFSLIIFAVGFRFFYSLFEFGGIQGGNFSFFYQGLIGFVVFLIIGNLFYYGRLFAGGDAKLMIALGPILGFTNIFTLNLVIFVAFLFLFLLTGAVYGVLFSLWLSFSNFKVFKNEFLKQFSEYIRIIHLITAVAVLFTLLGTFNSTFIYIGILIFLAPYIYIYAKAVDEACMKKEVSTKILTEGDWLLKEVKAGRKIIKASWDGLSKKDIKILRKYKKKVLIKQGIPFVPVFLISFLIFIYMYYTGNLFNFGLLRFF